MFNGDWSGDGWGGDWAQQRMAGPMHHRPPMPMMMQQQRQHPYYGGAPPPRPMATAFTPSPNVRNAALRPTPQSTSEHARGRHEDEDDMYSDFAAPAKPLPLLVEFSTSAIKCQVRWRAPLHIPVRGDYVYAIEAHGHNVQTMQLPSWKTQIQMRTTPGQWYTVWVRVIVRGKCYAEGSVQFKAIFTREEMMKLHKNAVEFVGDDMHEFEYMYRCKPSIYFDDIRDNRNHVMEPYQKDDNGQAASPINGTISGLFFSAKLARGGLPTQSPFGNIRMAVPAAQLFNMQTHRAWFADFYCNYTTHYVTIVLTKRGSTTDIFCEKALVPVDMSSNPFMQCVCQTTPFGQTFLQYTANRNVWVELYYTDNVPLAWGRFLEIIATGAGSSKPGGLPHNKYCHKCNLYPIEQPRGRKPHEQAEPDSEEAPGPEFNSTLALCIEIERDRLKAEHNAMLVYSKSAATEPPVIDDQIQSMIERAADATTAEDAKVEDDRTEECGDADLIECLCSLVDSVVENVGDTIRDVPFVGTPYAQLSSSLRQHTFDVTTEQLAMETELDYQAKPKIDDDVMTKVVEFSPPLQPMSVEGVEFISFVTKCVEELNAKCATINALMSTVQKVIDTETIKVASLQKTYDKEMELLSTEESEEPQLIDIESDEAFLERISST